MPSSIGQLENLTELVVYTTGIEGSIPQELCNLENLVSLAIFNNDNISGLIPECTQTQLQNLESLILPQGVPGLRRNDIYKLQIQLPKLQLQDEIINELENLEFLIYNLEKSISGINKIYSYKLKKTFN